MGKFDYTPRSVAPLLFNPNAFVLAKEGNLFLTSSMQLAFSVYKTRCPNKDGYSKVILDWLSSTRGPPNEYYFFVN